MRQSTINFFQTTIGQIEKYQELILQKNQSTMGKKSKRKSSEGMRATRNAASNINISNEFSKLTVTTSPETPNFPTPPNGWALELEEVQKKIKKAKTTPSIDNFLRLCRAYRMLRQWEDLVKWSDKVLVKLTQNDDNNDLELRQELLKYKQEAETVLSKRSRVDHSDLRDWFDKIMAGDQCVDDSVWQQQSFSNLNSLQWAVMQGDIRMMEKVVALGAALDYPPMNLNHPIGGGEPAPPDCSALLIACSSLALNATIRKLPVGRMMQFDNNINSCMEGILECALQLVRLGADCKLKLNIPATSKGMALSMWRQFGFNGKSAKQLAMMSGYQELIDTMEAFEGKDALIRKAHCRCGSRLPWKDCHLGDLPVETLTHESKKENKLLFRYSPMAPCYCKTPNKTYWSCCWDSSSPRYAEDRTGDLTGKRILSSGAPGGAECMALTSTLAAMAKASGIPEDSPICGNRSPDEIRTGAAQAIREFGIPPGGADKRKYDREVYAGIVERLDNFFLWRQDHWALEKVELGKRVQEWNDALEQYCDEEDIHGEEREQVIRLHEATPLAPCANPACSKVEIKIKEFKNCSACRTVGYCSVDCQKKHWKVHKRGCVKR